MCVCRENTHIFMHRGCGDTRPGGWKRDLWRNCAPTSQPKGRGWKPSVYGCARQCPTRRDTHAAVPVIEATRERFPELLACSFDRGFHSPQNQAALGDRLELNAMPAKGRLSPSRRAHEVQPDFALARQQHPAVESAINNLEQRGLDRVRPMARMASHAR